MAKPFQLIQQQRGLPMEGPKAFDLISSKYIGCQVLLI